MPFFRDLVLRPPALPPQSCILSASVLIISLGVGATTAIFSLINGVLLNALPYRDSARLAVMWSDFSPQKAQQSGSDRPRALLRLARPQPEVQSMAAFFYTNPTFTALDRPITPPTHEVTPNFFDTSGVQAFRGRTFLPDEGLPGKNGVAVISYSLWRSVFAGAESAVGSSVELDGRSVQIIGVLPPAFRAPTTASPCSPICFFRRPSIARE